MAYVARDLISEVQNKLLSMKDLKVRPASQNALVRGVYDGLNVGRWLLDQGMTTYHGDLGPLLSGRTTFKEVLTEFNSHLDKKTWVPITLFEYIAYRTAVPGTKETYVEGVVMGYYHATQLYGSFLGLVSKEQAIKLALKRIFSLRRELEHIVA